MSSVNGQLVTCDRCGNTTFRKVTGEGEADGGYTRWNKFEDIPEGWGSGHWTERQQYKTLCPECMTEYNKMLEVFWEKSNNEN